MAKVGKGQVTKDAVFKQEKEKFDERHKMMTQLERSVDKYLKALHGLFQNEHLKQSRK